MYRLIVDANCSPFCAIFVLRRCSQDLATQLPDVLYFVHNNYFMDDFIQSLSTTAAARRLTKILGTVLHRGVFRLTKFISNNSDALSSVPAEDRGKSTPETKVVRRGIFALTPRTGRHLSPLVNRLRSDKFSAWFHLYSTPSTCYNS